MRWAISVAVGILLTYIATYYSQFLYFYILNRTLGLIDLAFESHGLLMVSIGICIGAIQVLLLGEWKR